MFRLPKSLVLAAAGAGLFVTLAGEASACHGRGGGGYRVAYRPAYSTPQCHPQVVQQPQLQPFQQLQLAQQQQQGFQQPGFQQAGVQQQGFQQGAPVGQSQNLAGQFAGAPAGSTASASAMSALGGVSSPSVGGQTQVVQNVGGQTAQSIQNVGGQAAQSVQNFGGQAGAVAPQAGGSSQVAQGAAPAAPSNGVQNTTPAAAESNAQSSALEALMGISGTSAAQQTSAQPQASLPTGEFSATLSNGTQIRLSLRADGSFSWVAMKDGKPSSFQGTFSLSGSALTLLRGNDSQKLEGTLTMTANGFTLRLAGQNDNGLAFVRG